MAKNSIINKGDLIYLVLAAGLTIFNHASAKRLNRANKKFENHLNDMIEEGKRKRLEKVEVQSSMTTEQYCSMLNGYVKQIKECGMTEEEKIKEAARRMGYDVGD